MTKTYTERIFELTCPYDNEYQGTRRRLLFVCSAGMLRSPTGARVAIELGYNARSCGSAEYALIPLSVNLINWAEKIYFVEENNYQQALETFSMDAKTTAMLNDKAVVLEIEDYYNYSSPILIEKFKEILT